MLWTSLVFGSSLWQLLPLNIFLLSPYSSQCSLWKIIKSCMWRRNCSKQTLLISCDTFSISDDKGSWHCSLFTISLLCPHMDGLAMLTAQLCIWALDYFFPFDLLALSDLCCYSCTSLESVNNWMWFGSQLDSIFECFVIRWFPLVLEFCDYLDILISALWSGVSVWQLGSQLMLKFVLIFLADLFSFEKAYLFICLLGSPLILSEIMILPDPVLCSMFCWKC